MSSREAIISYATSMSPGKVSISCTTTMCSGKVSISFTTTMCSEKGSISYTTTMSTGEVNISYATSHWSLVADVTPPGVQGSATGIKWSKDGNLTWAHGSGIKMLIVPQHMVVTISCYIIMCTGNVSISYTIAMCSRKCSISYTTSMSSGAAIISYATWDANPSCAPRSWQKDVNSSTASWSLDYFVLQRYVYIVG
jgi:hypothetical protein